MLSQSAREVSYSVGPTASNVAFEASNEAGTQTDNSWQRDGEPTPLSTDPSSDDFLVPAPGFDDLGAHAGR